MKRPDGWDELYLEAYRKEYSGEGHGSPERAMFEAGADAFEEVLKERGLYGICTGDLECFCMVLPDQEKSPFSSNFPKWDNEHPPMYPNDIAQGKGWLVFIPEEVE